MNNRLLQFSAVVAGQAHNPTILNPDFLELQGIVPKSWGWKVLDVMTTLPLSVVKYENGVSVTVEQGKLQVTDPNVEEGIKKSKVTDIASAYVRTLKHVQYTAVGNNFQGLIPRDGPGLALKKLFLKGGSWDRTNRRLEAVGILLVYPLEVGKFRLSIDSAEATLPTSADKQPVIITNANFSRDCLDQPSFETVCDHLLKAVRDWEEYETIVRDIEKEAT